MRKLTHSFWLFSASRNERVHNAKRKGVFFQCLHENLDVVSSFKYLKFIFSRTQCCHHRSLLYNICEIWDIFVLWNQRAWETQTISKSNFWFAIKFLTFHSSKKSLYHLSEIFLRSRYTCENKHSHTSSELIAFSLSDVALGKAMWLMLEILKLQTTFEGRSM